MATHRLSRKPLYRAWSSMKGRCHNKKNGQFIDYGARGISVCDLWRNDYLSFHNWAMSAGWKQGLTIERINNNDGYKPENCRIISKQEQPRNRRSCIWIEAFGKKQILSDWAREKGINFTTIKSRIKMGWSIEDSLSVPSKIGGWAHRTSFRKPGTPRKLNENNTWIIFEGETKILNDWAKIFGLGASTIISRIDRGWSIQNSLTVPVGGDRVLGVRKGMVHRVELQ